MRKFLYLLFLVVSTVHLTAQVPIYNNFDPANPSNPDVGLINSIGAGAGGLDVSVLQDISLSMTIYGFGAIHALDQSIADDFTISTNASLSSVDLYAYQSSSGPMSTSINEAYIRIWDGPPGTTGSNIVFGDFTTNRLTTSNFTGIYRVLENTIMSSVRAIQRLTVNIGTSLPAGTYWLEFALNGSVGFSGPWAPPITVSGSTGTGNALQSLDNGATYDPIVDIGGQDFPFVISGFSSSGVPTLGQWSLIVLALLLMIIGVVMISKNQVLQSKMKIGG